MDCKPFLQQSALIFILLVLKGLLERSFENANQLVDIFLKFPSPARRRDKGYSSGLESPDQNRSPRTARFGPMMILIGEPPPWCQRGFVGGQNDASDLSLLPHNGDKPMALTLRKLRSSVMFKPDFTMRMIICLSI